MKEKPRPIMSIPQAAGYVGISARHAYELARSGRFPVAHLGGRMVVSRQVLDQWIADECANGLTTESPTQAFRCKPKGSR